MRLVGRNLDDVVALTELLALLVEHHAVLVEVFSLPDDGGLTQVLRGHAPGRPPHAVNSVKRLGGAQAAHALGRLDTRQRGVTVVARLRSGEREARPAVGVAKFVRELAKVVPDFLNLVELLAPLGDRVGWLLLLEPLQDGLVLHRNLHELLLALHAVQGGLLNSLGVVERRLRVLHDVAHLLEQDSVLALDLRVAAYAAGADMRGR